VSAWDPTGGDTRESFVIAANTIAQPSPLRSAQWAAINLKPTSGAYSVSNNKIG
jgi:hypothetical protein